jgi:pimeloyl-ACP methyl ester carboxylesterase
LILAAHDMAAHPALMWTADHPEEIACLVYMEVPTMLEEFLTKVIVYTPEAMAQGSMWWWVLPLAGKGFDVQRMPISRPADKPIDF